MLRNEWNILQNYDNMYVDYKVTSNFRKDGMGLNDNNTVVFQFKEDFP